MPSSCLTSNFLSSRDESKAKHPGSYFTQAKPFAYVKSTIISMDLFFNIFAKGIIKSNSASAYFLGKLGFKFLAYAAPSIILPDIWNVLKRFSIASTALIFTFGCNCSAILTKKHFIELCLNFKQWPYKLLSWSSLSIDNSFSGSSSMIWSSKSMINKQIFLTKKNFLAVCDLILVFVLGF